MAVTPAPALGEEGLSARVDALAAQLLGTNKLSRMDAARELIRIGKPGVRELNQVLFGDLWKVMGANAHLALSAFADVGPESVPIMVELIRGADSFDFNFNPGVTGILILGTNAFPGLEKLLRDPDPEMRHVTIYAARILGMSPETCAGAARLLIGAAKDDIDVRVRCNAVFSLGACGPPFSVVPGDVRKTLRQLLNDNVESVRITAAFSLVRACPDCAGAAAPLILKHIAAAGTNQTFESVLALENLGTNAAAGIPEIIAALDTPDSFVENRLTNVLGCLATGVPAERYTTPKALRKEIVTELGNAASLTKLHKEAVVAILLAVLKDRDAGIRMAAVYALRSAAASIDDPKVAATIVAKLKEALADPDEFARNSAKRALDEIQSAGAKLKQE